MILTALHPAHVRYVRPRARKETSALVSVQSPVEIREDDLSRSVEVGPLFPGNPGLSAEPVRLLDGRLWMPVAFNAGASGLREATLPEFSDWLAGRNDPMRVQALGDRFLGSPLVALTPNENTVFPVYQNRRTRGDAVDLSGARGIPYDGRERARFDLGRYLDEEIRILDGRPFMRVAPLLMLDASQRVGNAWIEPRLNPTGTRIKVSPATPGTVDRVADLHRALGRTPFDVEGSADIRRWSAIVPGTAVEGDDARWVLTTFAEKVRRDLDGALSDRNLEAAHERMTRVRPALLDVEIAAMTGTAHWECEASLRAVSEALAAIGVARAAARPEGELLAEFIDRILLADIEARQSAELDAASLSPP